MKNLNFKVNTIINNISLEIRGFDNHLIIMAVNPSDPGHKISKTIETGNSSVTAETAISFVESLEGIQDFVEKSKSIFADPACAITE